MKNGVNSTEELCQSVPPTGVGGHSAGYVGGPSTNGRTLVGDKGAIQKDPIAKNKTLN